MQPREANGQDWSRQQDETVNETVNGTANHFWAEPKQLLGEGRRLGTPIDGGNHNSRRHGHDTTCVSRETEQLKNHTTRLRLGLVEFPLGLDLVLGSLVDGFARGQVDSLPRRRRIRERLLRGRLFLLLPLLLALLLKGQARLNHLELGGVELGRVDALPHTDTAEIQRGVCYRSDVETAVDAYSKQAQEEPSGT